MGVYKRVADEPDVVDFATGKLKGIPGYKKKAQTYAIVKHKKYFRLREEHGDLARAQNSASVRLGPFVRRYDPDARDKEGKIAQFNTVSQAIYYVERWL